VEQWDNGILTQHSLAIILLTHQGENTGKVTLLDLDMRPALQVLATRLTYLPSRLFLYELNSMILIGQRTPDDSGLYYT
jgi:hypothetical protein